MIKRPAWIAIVLFIVLAAFTFFLEKRAGEFTFSKNTPTPTIYKVVNGSDPDLVRVKLVSEEKEIIAEKDPESGWKIVEPIDSSVDTALFLEKLAEITSLKVYTLLKSDTTDDQLGIDTTLTLKIIMEDNDGQQEQILIGDLTPIESGYYARLTNGDAVVLNKISIENIKDLFSEYYPE